MRRSRKENDGPEVPAWEFKEPPWEPASNTIDLGLPREASRRDFREPVGPDEEVAAVLGGRKFQVVDIGSRGIGIFLPAPGDLREGEMLEIDITLDDNVLHFRGKVAHISREVTEGYHHCGIEFVELGKETETQLREFIQKHHAKLFGKAPGFL